MHHNSHRRLQRRRTRPRRKYRVSNFRFSRHYLTRPAATSSLSRPPPFSCGIGALPSSNRPAFSHPALFSPIYNGYMKAIPNPSPRITPLTLRPNAQEQALYYCKHTRHAPSASALTRSQTFTSSLEVSICYSVSICELHFFLPHCPAHPSLQDHRCPKVASLIPRRRSLIRPHQHRIRWPDTDDPDVC
jgi:hypothetical protein